MRILGSKRMGARGGWMEGEGQIEGPQEPGRKGKMVHSTNC